MVTLDRPSIDVDDAQPALRPYSSADFAWAVQLLEATGGRFRVRRNRVVDLAVLPGLIAEQGVPQGLVTMSRPSPEEFELSVIAVDPFAPDVVALLLAGARRYAGADCRRIYTICSNAEFDLQRELQRNEFTLCAARPGAVSAVGERSERAVASTLGGVAVRDELEFEQLLLPA